MHQNAYRKKNEEEEEEEEEEEKEEKKERNGGKRRLPYTSFLTILALFFSPQKYNLPDASPEANILPS